MTAASLLCVTDDEFEALLDSADADCAYVGVFNEQRHLTTPSIFVSRRRVKAYPIVLSSIYELLFCSKPVEVRAHSFLVEIEYRGSSWRAALLRAADKAPFDDGIGRRAEAALRRVAEGLELYNALEDSMRRFRVSEREREVLELLFRGYRDREIALRLTLALSTVQDHIRHIVAKTQSRTRLEMAARILGWR